MIRVINVFDSFRPFQLLDVRFELTDEPTEQIRTYRTSYGDIRELDEKGQNRLYKTERKEKK